jgi:hypothetical protein
VFLAGGGTNGLVVSQNDGGIWSGAALTGQAWQALWGLSATDVYAVGDGGIFAHYSGAWTQLASVPGGKNLHGVWASSDTDVFAVGGMGTIMHYDGAMWTAQTSGVATNITLNAVWGTASNDVYAVGGAGTIVHYDGTSWRHLVSNTGEDLYSIGGTGHDDVFIGGRGTLLHSGGINWAPMQTGIGDVFGMSIARGDSLFVGNVSTISGLDAGGLLFTRTPLGTVEGICGDPWDNDGDGKIDCADDDCVGFNVCTGGGACFPTTPIACGETTSGASTFTGAARLDDLPCLDHSTPGPEASYRVRADHDGDITVTLVDASGILDVVEIDPFDDTSVDPTKRRISCDPSHCISAPPASGMRTLTFPAKAGETYYVLVDGPAATGEPFDLSVTCP